MRTSTDMFCADGGIHLFERQWQPAQEPSAVVAIVHGYSEHSDRYVHLARVLTGEGYAVAGFDLRGHGHSQGKRGYVDDFDHYLRDLDLFIGRLRDRYPDKPMFLFGHSLGGSICTLYVIDRRPNVNGLILSGAALTFTEDISPVLRSVISVVSRLAPSIPTVPMGNGAIIMRDPIAIRRYNEDPLVYRNRVPARTGAEVFRAIQRIMAGMHTVSMPLLIMHGTEDLVTDLNGSRQFHLRARSTDKTLKLYNGFYHSLLEETEKEQVLSDLCAWLAERTDDKRRRASDRIVAQ